MFPGPAYSEGPPARLVHAAPPADRPAFSPVVPKKTQESSGEQFANGGGRPWRYRERAVCLQRVIRLHLRSGVLGISELAVW
jgi:hypothetical protein